MTGPRQILIATGNPGKLREIQSVTAHLPVAWRTLADFPGLPQAIESADAFAANAAIKARHYSGLTGLWTLADDSGLEVDALDGAPGVRSARYAGTPTNDRANNAKLVAALRSVPDEDRSARFRCALALADGDAVIATSEGTFEGRIVDEPRGQNGFGYDPHFFVLDHRMTAAEMSARQKNAISHRGKALSVLISHLERLLG